MRKLLLIGLKDVRLAFRDRAALILMLLGLSMVSQLTDFTRYVFEVASQAGQ